MIEVIKARINQRLVDLYSYQATPFANSIRPSNLDFCKAQQWLAVRGVGRVLALVLCLNLGFAFLASTECEVRGLFQPFHRIMSHPLRTCLD